MDQDTFLYTLPQWFIFSAIIASVYGWVEQKKIFRMIGPVIIIFLGIFAGYAIYRGYFSAYKFLTPEEIISEETGKNTPGEIPFLARLLPAYLAFIFSGILAIPAFILEWKNRKGKSRMIILTLLTGLIGFFIIVGALKDL